MESGLVVVEQAESKRRLSLWSTGRKDHARSGETKFKLQMAQSITGAIARAKMGVCDGITVCFAMS